MGMYTLAIQKLYVAYFGRPADSAGLAYWEAAANNQQGVPQEISANFAKSQEYRETYAGLSNSALVNQVYLNLFNRDAEYGGLRFWTDMLDRHMITIDNVVTAVAAGAQGSDATTFSNKASAAGLFTSGLDSPEYQGKYQGNNALVVSKLFISSISDDASFARLIGPAKGLQSALNTLAQAHDNTLAPTTVLLTRDVTRVAPSIERPLLGDDVFNAPAGSSGFPVVDNNSKIDGGLGTNTLNITSASGYAYSLDGYLGLSHIQNMNLTADAAVQLDARTWNDLRKLDVTAKGGATLSNAAGVDIRLSNTDNGGKIMIDGGANVAVNVSGSKNSDIVIGSSVMPSGNIEINTILTAVGRGNDSSGYIQVSGGKSITFNRIVAPNVDLNPNNPPFVGPVTIKGSAITSSVSINNPIVPLNNSSNTSSSVTIIDASNGSNQSGSIKNISVQNVNHLMIKDNALENLSLANVKSDVSISNGGLAKPSNTSLNLNADGLQNVDFSDNGVLSNLNLNLTGSDSTFYSVSLAALRTLNLTGNKNLSIVNIYEWTSTAALRNINIKGAAGIKGDFSRSGVTSIDASASTGSTSVTINSSKTTYIAGAGSDQLSLSDDAVASISLGAGNDSLTCRGTQNKSLIFDGGSGFDTLAIPASFAISLAQDPAAVAMWRNFERLDLGLASNGQIDLAAFGQISAVSIFYGYDFRLDNFISGGTLELSGSGEAYTIANPAFLSGSNDVLNLKLSNNAIFGGANVNAARQGISAEGVETVNITTAFTQSYPNEATSAAVTLLGNSATTITATGNTLLNLRMPGNALTLLDASKLGAGLTFTGGALSHEARILGSSTGVNHVDFSAAQAAVHYTGGIAADTVTLSGYSNTVQLGSGADVVVLEAANIDLAHYSTVLDPHAGMSIRFTQNSGNGFIAQAIQSAGSDVSSAANNSVLQAGNAVQGGVVNWFQLNGDTYIVQALHGNGNNSGFIEGNDTVVKLTGLVDLSQASFVKGTTLILH